MPVICSGVKGINSKKITYVIEVFFRISKTFCFLHRYENDYVSVKENIRSLWDSVDQLETVCQAGRRTTVTLPATQSPIKHKSAASTSEQLARFIQGFSEEKAFLRKSLLDLNDSFSREYTTWTNTVEKKFNVINEIDAKCSSTEKNVEKLRDAQTALMKEIERKSEKLSAEVSALQVMINQALEEVIQNSILNQPCKWRFFDVVVVFFWRQTTLIKIVERIFTYISIFTCIYGQCGECAWQSFPVCVLNISSKGKLNVPMLYVRFNILLVQLTRVLKGTSNN